MLFTLIWSLFHVLLLLTHVYLHLLAYISNTQVCFQSHMFSSYSRRVKTKQKICNLSAFVGNAYNV